MKDAEQSKRSNRPFPKRQHFVPRFYLKQFATTDTQHRKRPQAWAWPVKEGDPYLASISDLAVEAHLYSPEEKHGRSRAMEDELSSLEHFLGTHWLSLVGEDRALDIGFKRALSLMLVTLWLRNPSQVRTRSKYWRDEKRNAELALALNPDHSRIWASNEKGILMPKASNLSRFTQFSETTLDSLAIKEIKALAGPLLRMLLLKKWAVLRCSTPLFATSDHPIAVFDRDNDRLPITAPNATIQLPLTPNRCLLLDHPRTNPDHIHDMLPNGHRSTNHLTLRSAHRVLISHRHTDEVLPEVTQLLDSKGG